MKNKIKHKKYKCPYTKIFKGFPHNIKIFPKNEAGPSGYNVWCKCGFHGPVCELDKEN